MVEQLNDLFLLQQDGTGTLSPLTLDILKTVSNYINRILVEQRKTKGAIKIQAFTRGFLVRKQMRAIKPYIPTFMNVKMVFIDLVKTERQYIHDLKSAINTYLVPCRAKATTGEEHHDILNVFSNIEAILAVHQTLLREILHIQEFSWPLITGLGRLFMNHAIEFQNYGDYAENCATARSTLRSIRANKKHKFKDVIES